MATEKKPFGISDKIGYAFGDFGNDFTFMLSSMFMMKFYTDVMGVSAGLVGMLMMLARFVDAFTDVTMGQIVDRSTPTKDGKFKPWIRRMCGPLGVAAFLIFQGEFAGMPMGFKVFWMFFTYILWGSIFYTSVNIPYGSMASAITNKPEERAALSTFRSIGATCAGLVLGTFTPMVAYVTAANGATVLSGTRMTVLAAIFALCGIGCHMLCFTLCTERIEIPKNTTKLNVGKMLKSLVTNRALLGIILAALLLLLGMLGMSGMLPYVCPVYYGSKSAQSLISLLQSITALVICAPFAAKLAGKFGKKEISIVGALVCTAAWIICFIHRPANPMIFVAYYVVAYTALNFFNFVVWAMITDVIDDAEVKNGIREDGTIYSVYSFARKLGQALSSGVIGAALSSIGYSAAVASNPSEYPEILSAIFNMSCIIPAVGMALVALALIFVFPLNKARVDANSAELARRRAAKGKK